MIGFVLLCAYYFALTYSGNKAISAIWSVPVDFSRAML